MTHPDAVQFQVPHPPLSDLDVQMIVRQAHVARSHYLAGMVRSAVRFVARLVVNPMAEALAHRRALAEVRSLDAHTLADIGIDAGALETGTLRRRAVDIDVPLGGPVIWPTRPSVHSVPLSDVVPGAAANQTADNRHVA